MVSTSYATMNLSVLALPQIKFYVAHSKRVKTIVSQRLFIFLSFHLSFIFLTFLKENTITNKAQNPTNTNRVDLAGTTNPSASSTGNNTPTASVIIIKVVTVTLEQ